MQLEIAYNTLDISGWRYMDLVGSAGMLGETLRAGGWNTDPPLPETATMSTTQNTDKSTGAKILSGPRHNDLGTDADGDHHYWNRATGMVMVITDDGVRTQRYTVDEVNNWVRYVADRRGWTDLRYVDLRGFTPGEAIV